MGRECGHSGGLKGHGDSTGGLQGGARCTPLAMADPGTRAAMADQGTPWAMANPGTQAALADQGSQAGVADPGFP